MAINILLAQSNFLVREGLKSLINNENELVLSGEAVNPAELDMLLESTNPVVVIIDHLDPCFGIAAIRRIKTANEKNTILSI
ncbi:MAG TPA: hypothetical protein VFU15_09275, partial [Bacteroidia bacterium]|nr:hypothetical protein [Bacteroidia bacterium]